MLVTRCTFFRLHAEYFSIHLCRGAANGLQAAWEKLHTGCWKEVEPAWRDAYALACLLRALIRLLSLHVSLPAVSESACSGAPPRCLPRGSDRAPQPKKLQQTGEQVEISHSALGTEAQPAVIETPAAQSLTSTQELWSKPPCGGMAREGSGNEECAESSSDQQTAVHESTSGTAADGAIMEAMRELDLGIMMGGHAYQESLHAAIAIAQGAQIDGNEAANAGASQLSPVRNLEDFCEQNGHTQAEHGRKRLRMTADEGLGNGLSSEAGKEISCSTVPRVDQDSKTTAAWASTGLSKEDLRKLQEQLPPGASTLTPDIFITPALAEVCEHPCPQV